MKVAGLFAGIGGIELGLEQAGYRASLLVEKDEAAAAILASGFRDVERCGDVRTLRQLPAGVDLVSAGFPCQDLSQAGQTRGLAGSQSSLVNEVFRLIESRRRRVPWVVLENVPFMLQLRSGEAIRHIVERLEDLGYAWAYRTLDTRAFGLPQRRERVFLVASREVHPARLLFGTSVEPREAVLNGARLGCGFYWTEGTRGLGWAVDAVPTLKGGSTIGIPSPPAIWMPDDSIGTVLLNDAERLQGFPADWTHPAERVARATYRWKLVGNAVSVPVARWVGEQIAKGTGEFPDSEPFGTAWPKAAFGSRGGRFAVRSTTWPEAWSRPHLHRFLTGAKPLSLKATLGFYRRLAGSSLRYPPEFGAALRKHIALQERLRQPLLPALEADRRSLIL